MITSLDDQVGRIVAALEKKGLRENTLIIFSSDNGGATQRDVRQRRALQRGARARAASTQESLPASNGDLRGGKGSLYEGGVRAPTIFNWPGKLKPRVVNEPLHMVDIMPTVLALAGAKASPDKPLDGKDIWATVAEGATLAARRHPGQRRGVPRRHPQGQVEAGEDRAAAGQDRAVRSDRRSGREDQRRRRRIRRSSAIWRAA